MKIPTRVGSEAIDRRSPVGTKPRLRWSYGCPVVLGDRQLPSSSATT
jgi:hypothetical protein